jgi:hypothetical protein
MTNTTVETLKKMQGDLRTSIYRAMASENEALLGMLNCQYDGTVELLQKELGEDAPCWDVDCDLWNSYSDIFKDDYGFRPRQPVSRSYVKDWFERRERELAKHEAEGGTIESFRVS